MSEPHKDGGRAFPCDQIIERDANGHLHGKEVASGGMTLRDYFMATAPFSLADAIDALRAVGTSAPMGAEILTMLVGMRRAYADEMLKARQA